MFWVPGSLAGARQRKERCVRERHTRDKGTLLNAGGGGLRLPAVFPGRAVAPRWGCQAQPGSEEEASEAAHV